MGENVKQFEKEFAEYIGVKHAVSVGNGTDALIIALKALGIGHGDEVITTPFSFFATSEAISYVGAKPVFVDVERESYNLDPEKIEQAITENTKAILPVHIFGRSCKIDRILEIAKKHNLYVVEDAAQAAGCEYKGKKIGSFGDLACFSFFPTKNLGCYGDGGMITTNNPKLEKVVRALRAHGSGENGQHAYNILNNIEEEVEKDEGDNTVYNPKKYYNYLIGQNSRLDEIQAAILRVKLKHLDSWNEKRIEISEKYTDSIKNHGIRCPLKANGKEMIYHLYVLEADDREKAINILREKGISTGVYYPVPLNMQKVYIGSENFENPLKVADFLSKRTFAIPLFPELTVEEISYIIETMQEV